MTCECLVCVGEKKKRKNRKKSSNPNFWRMAKSFSFRVEMSKVKEEQAFSSCTTPACEAVHAERLGHRGASARAARHVSCLFSCMATESIARVRDLTHLFQAHPALTGLPQDQDPACGDRTLNKMASVHPLLLHRRACRAT